MEHIPHSVLFLSFLSIMLLLIGIFQNLKLYMKSHFREFLLLMAVFVLSLLAMGTVLLPLEDLIKVRIFFALSSLTYLPFLFLGHKIKGYPKPILYGLLLYGFLLAFSTPFWSVIEDTSKPVLPLMKFNTPIFEVHAGISIAGGILISNSFNAPLMVFRLAISLLLLYAMYSVEVVEGVNKMKIAKRIWVITLLVTTIHDFLFLTGSSIWTLILFNISLTLADYIVLFIPEGIILTRMQVLETYQRVSRVVAQRHLKDETDLNELQQYIIDVKELIENMK